MRGILASGWRWASRLRAGAWDVRDEAFVQRFDLQAEREVTGIHDHAIYVDHPDQPHGLHHVWAEEFRVEVAHASALPDRPGLVRHRGLLHTQPSDELVSARMGRLGWIEDEVDLAEAVDHAGCPDPRRTRRR